MILNRVGGLYFCIIIICIVQHVKCLSVGTPTDLTNKQERAFIMLKPDAVQRNLVGRIIERFEAKGLKLVALKFIHPSRELAEQHYNEHTGKPFYPQLIKFMTSGPVVPMVWEGFEGVNISRKMVGKSIVDLSIPGSIRCDYSVDRERNIIHAAHSTEAANREISLWFQEGELISWMPANSQWLNL